MPLAHRAYRSGVTADDHRHRRRRRAPRRSREELIRRDRGSKRFGCRKETSGCELVRRRRSSPCPGCESRRKSRKVWDRIDRRWAGCMVRAAAARVSAGVIAARRAAAVASPSVTGTIQTPVPTEVRRPPDAEVRIRAPTPKPRCGDPRPADPYTIDVLIRRSGAVGSFVDVLLAIRHPDPAILAGVDPLTRLVRWR